MKKLALSFTSLCLMTTIFSGCSTDTKRALGLTKQVPDEFAIITNTPLVVPPDFELTTPVDTKVVKTDSKTEEKAKDALVGTEKTAAEAKNTVTPEFTGFSGLSLSDVGSSSDTNQVAEAKVATKVEALKADVKGDDALLSKIKYDKDIRVKVTKDYNADVAENDTIVKDLLFWQKNDVEEKNVIDAAKEKERLNELKATGEKINGGSDTKK